MAQNISEKNRAFYDAVGTDLPLAMERFMDNESLYLRFLLKFADNEQFLELQNALDEQKYADALMTSHNLKSLTGNLSLMKLHSLLSEQVRQLRSEDYSGAAAAMKDISTEYERIRNVLKTTDITA